MNTFNIIITILWFIFLLYWLVSAVKSKKNIRNRAWSRGIAFRIGFIIVFILALKIPAFQNFFTETHSPLSGIIQLFGVIIAVLGVSLAIWARRHLGTNWGMPMSLKVNPELVTSGPYSYIRNPIYTGVLMALLGSAFVEGVFWLIPFVCAAMYFVYSSKVEEKIMLKEFPTQYPEYKKRTKMLIPFVF
jgi:protein-S-isoprenylcysteine O-methyltransferase Ste14